MDGPGISPARRSFPWVNWRHGSTKCPPAKQVVVVCRSGNRSQCWARYPAGCRAGAGHQHGWRHEPVGRCGLSDGHRAVAHRIVCLNRWPAAYAAGFFVVRILRGSDWRLTPLRGGAAGGTKPARRPPACRRPAGPF